MISQDVTPYTLVAGNHAKAYKINSVGLKRKGFDEKIISDLEKTFKLFVKSKKTKSEERKSTANLIYLIITLINLSDLSWIVSEELLVSV